LEKLNSPSTREKGVRLRRKKRSRNSSSTFYNDGKSPFMRGGERRGA